MYAVGMKNVCDGSVAYEVFGGGLRGETKIPIMGHEVEILQ
jgi:hypothetical protein